MSLLVLLAGQSSAQAPQATRVDPPNWWGGMHLDSLRLLVYGSHLDGVHAVSMSPDLVVLHTVPAASPSYVFVDVRVLPSAAGTTPAIRLERGSESATVSFPVYRRPAPQGRYQGFSNSDIIYLITPDRFANGDPSNDNVTGMVEGVNRSWCDGRHGGDIQGILSHLDYVRELGATTIWINPLIENNFPMVTYHGYAATDLYRIDPRYGSNALYARLVSEAHTRGLKVIMDHVNNHISASHQWMGNPPTATWFHGTAASHLRSNSSRLTLVDIHADSVSREVFTSGWFTDAMPDLNQRDASLADYLIANAIWWIESSGIDGIREDTAPYMDQDFLTRWVNTIRNEYPGFTIVGEVWMDDPTFIAPFQRGSTLVPSLHPSLESVTDFGMFKAFEDVFANNESIYRIYETLAKDFLFPDPNRLMVFLDNHDLKRINWVTRGDTARTHEALTMLFTVRGIPEMLYGTELGLQGGKDDGHIRMDFPGGFPGDSLNAFEPTGRTPEEQRMFQFTQALLRLRKEHPALTRGSLTQFRPSDEVYCYTRQCAGDTVVVLVNNSRETRTVEFESYLHRPVTLKNLIAGAHSDEQQSSITLKPYGTAVLGVKSR